MVHEDLPHRTPGQFGFPCYPTTLPSAALLIRVAEGLDEWAERDRRELENQRIRLDKLASMENQAPNAPLTYHEALRIARDLAKDPGSLIPYPHQALENARNGRGFAFLDTTETDRGAVDGYVLVTETGHTSGVFGPDGRTVDMAIAEHLARADHANRHIPDSELSVAHRLALDAYDAGLASTNEIPGRAGIDAETADYAEFILLNLWRNDYQADSGRKILAGNDFLLRGPTPGRRYTQPCSHCERPAIYQESYPRAVCDHCLQRAADRAGRRVTGSNTHTGAAMIAYYTDSLEYAYSSGSRPEECVEVTRTGVCFVDGEPATMHASRFGGILVQMASADSSVPRAPRDRIRRVFRRA